jgi:hypothetical protein
MGAIHLSEASQARGLLNRRRGARRATIADKHRVLGVHFIALEIREEAMKKQTKKKGKDGSINTI